MARTRIVWTERAKEGRRQIRDWIAKDAPRTAARLEKRLIAEVSKLKRFPFLGAVLEDFGAPDVREFYFKTFRIIYRVSLPTIQILIVQRGAKQLRLRDLEQE